MVFCETLADALSRSPVSDVMALRRATVRVDTFLAEQLQWRLREAEASVSSLQRAEPGVMLQELLAQRLTGQIEPGHSSQSIRRFVTRIWAKVLAESMVRFGEHAEPTPMSVKTVDELLWSLQTPDHPQCRQRLIALPASSDSLIDLASIQTVSACLLDIDSSAPAETGKRVDALTIGERLRLFLRGRWVPVQSLWRSDKGSFFLFAGLMKPLQDWPMVQRAFDALANPLWLPA